MLHSGHQGSKRKGSSVRVSERSPRLSRSRVFAAESTRGRSGARWSRCAAARRGTECDRFSEREDDAGFSGGNTDRPAFQRLMADVEQGGVDGIVVYKIDRLSRSLVDFAKIMEVCEQHDVALVSATQQFNTSTSMGRLILNVLLSFARFEGR